MSESEAVQRNIAFNERAAARARARNGERDPAATTPAPDNSDIADVAQGREK
jgi:hypothetical protein